MMKAFLLVICCCFADCCFSQEIKMDSLTMDSLLHVGYEQSASILAHQFDTCTGYDIGYLESEKCYNYAGGDSIVESGSHTGCCDKITRFVYHDGKLIARLTEENGRNSAVYFVGDYLIMAGWDRNYAPGDIWIQKIQRSSDLWIDPN